MSEMNPVDSLLKRLSLENYMDAFREQNIVNSKTLKSMSQEDIADLIPQIPERQKLLDAIAGGDVPHGLPQGRSSVPHHDDRQIFDDFSTPSYNDYDDRPRKGKGKGKGGKGKGKGGKNRDRDYSYNDEETFGGGKGYGGGGGGGKGGKNRGGGQNGQSFYQLEDFAVWFFFDSNSAYFPKKK